MSKKDVESKENEIFEQIDGLQQAKQDPECNLLTVQNRYVECIAKHYENQGLSHDEMIAAGNKGLLVAAECYRPNTRFRFVAYAVWWIRHYILLAIEENKN